MTLLLLPNFTEFYGASARRVASTPLVFGRDLLLFALTPALVYGFVNWTWCGSTTTLWFNHLIFGGLQLKTSLLITASFSLLLSIVLLSLVVTAQESYDYLAVWYNCFF